MITRPSDPQAMRMQAVKAIQGGPSATEVAKAFGIYRRTVYGWMAKYLSGGQNALKAIPIPGRPSKLSTEQMQWIAEAVCGNTPQQYQFEFALWTLKIIGKLIEREFKVKLSINTLSRVMKLLGFSTQKPLYQAWQQDEKLVRQQEEELNPEIRKEARRVCATIYFADESGIRSDYHTGHTWAPKGEMPVLSVTGRRFSLNMISAISAQGQQRFMIHQGTVTVIVFREFLKRLMVGANNPVFVIVDGHPTHKAKLVKKYVESLNGQLKHFFLPSYSPQLNPDETVWAHVKREVGKKTVVSLEEMKVQALSALHRLQKMPGLLKSFFEQPEVQYARM
jgi:transposase